ncbi:MAG TPA: hypothetical protein VHE57_11720 [Mycobacteriales bacterium]|nr:hypothetical protein [Mycobacteriales bacterium]
MGKVLQVRDVSDETYASLSRQADKRGQSLSQYLRDELDELARRGDSVEHNLRIFREAQAEPGPKVSTEDIVAALHEGRSER